MKTADIMKKLFLLPLLCLSFAQAETINCKVVGVTDGDTITCLTDQKEQIKVKLYQIDAPEAGQDFGQKSKQALSNLVFGEQVAIETHGKDKYKRTLGTILGGKPIPQKYIDESIIIKGWDVNHKMIALGMAWHYPFSRKNKGYIETQKEAQQYKIGLWSQPNPIPPWEWRKQQKVKK